MFLDSLTNLFHFTHFLYTKIAHSSLRIPKGMKYIRFFNISEKYSFWLFMVCAYLQNVFFIFYLSHVTQKFSRKINLQMNMNKKFNLCKWPIICIHSSDFERSMIRFPFTIFHIQVAFIQLLITQQKNGCIWEIRRSLWLNEIILFLWSSNLIRFDILYRSDHFMSIL